MIFIAYSLPIYCCILKKNSGTFFNSQNPVIELSRAELSWVELSQAESSWVELSQAESSINNIIMIKIKTRIILSKYAHREFCSSGGLLSWAYYDISCLNSCRHHLSQFYETTQKYQLVCPTTVHSASNFLNQENVLKNCEICTIFSWVFCLI